VGKVRTAGHILPARTFCLAHKQVFTVESFHVTQNLHIVLMKKRSEGTKISSKRPEDEKKLPTPAFICNKMITGLNLITAKAYEFISTVYVSNDKSTT